MATPAVDFSHVVDLLTVVEKIATNHPNQFMAISKAAMDELTALNEEMAQAQAEQQKKADEEKAKKEAAAADAKAKSAARSDGQPTPTPMGTAAGDQKLNLGDARR